VPPLILFKGAKMTEQVQETKVENLTDSDMETPQSKYRKRLSKEQKALQKNNVVVKKWTETVNGKIIEKSLKKNGGTYSRLIGKVEK
jgi:hypothetical protein